MNHDFFVETFKSLTNCIIKNVGKKKAIKNDKMDMEFYLFLHLTKYK
jgi:hypothetical protein